jgi:hypothetical protein
LIRLIGLFTTDPFVAVNVFYLFSFASVAFTACWVLQRNDIERLPAIAGAIAFSLLPYHFLRVAHIFLASYAAIPVFCHYALRLATIRHPMSPACRACDGYRCSRSRSPAGPASTTRSSASCSSQSQARSDSAARIIRSHCVSARPMWW